MRVAYGVLCCAVALAACTKPNPEVCCTSPQDCSAIGISDPMRACAAGLVCANHTCGTPACSSNSDCSGATPACDTTTHTCVACIDNSQCGGTTPTCDPMTQTCIGCTDSSQCSGATPVCNTMSMTCVGCLDSSQCMNPAPVCDMSSMTCRTCTTDDECASKVCDVDSGSCVDGSSILYAAPAASDTSDCGLNTPCSITHAIALADAVKNTIRMLPGTYTGPLTVSGKAITIIGTGATTSTAMTSSIALSITAGANVGIRGLAIQGGVNGALFCAASASLSLRQLDLMNGFNSEACNITLDQVRLLDGGTLGYGISGGTMTVDRSMLTGTLLPNTTGSVSITLTNSILLGGIDMEFLTSSSAVHASFSTLIGGEGCLPDATKTPSVVLDDDLFFGNSSGGSDSLTVNAGCTIKNALSFPQATTISGVVSTMDPKLVDPANGNYHLQAGSPAIDLADPTATDSHDYDGTPRPQGTRDDIGAFEYHP